MWIYAIDGKNVGPVSFEEIVKLIQAGTISQQTVVCEIGQKPCRAGQNPKLQRYFSSTNIQTANPQPSAKQDVKSIPKPTTVPKTGAKTQKKSSFPIVPVAIAGSVFLILALVAGLFLVSGKKKSADNPTPVASAKATDTSKEEKEEVEEKVEEEVEEKIPEETPEEKATREAKEKEEQEAREKEEKERKQREEERQKQLDKLEQNRKEAEKTGKVLVILDDLHNEAKSPADYCPNLPEFEDYRMDTRYDSIFWHCIFNPNYESKYFKPTITVSSYEVKSDMEKQGVIFLTHPSYNHKDNGLFAAFYDECVLSRKPLSNTVNLKIDHFGMCVQEHNTFHVLNKDGTIKTVSIPEDSYGYDHAEYQALLEDFWNTRRTLINRKIMVYTDDIKGLYTVCYYSLYVNPELKKDIKNHVTDYRVEVIVKKITCSESEKARGYLLPMLEETGDNIIPLLNADESEQAVIVFNRNRAGLIHGEISAIQIRNIKTNKIIAAAYSDDRIVKTEVLDIKDVIHQRDSNLYGNVSNVNSGQSRTKTETKTQSQKEEKEPDDPNRFVQKINGIPFVYRWCPAGEFTMGSPEDEEDRAGIEKQHKVKLSKGFWILETEVTYDHYLAITGKNLAISDDSKSRNNSGNNNRNMGAYPVENISWDECVAFCQACKEKGMNVKLPTEAQWEYACRSGTDGPFASNMEQVTCYADNSGGHACPVKEYGANAWKIYGMHGNVAEWCADWGGPYKLEDQTDPTGPGKGTKRITRGGSWGSSRSFCRSAFRGSLEPNKKTPGLGFRLILLGHDKDE